MNRNRFGWIFGISDFLSTAAAWLLFYIYRKLYNEPAVFGDIDIEFGHRFFMGILLIPTFWVLMYYTIGSYSRLYRRSRIKDLGNTFMVSLLGTLLIFFVLILDDFVKRPELFRKTYLVLFTLTFLLRYLPRFAILTYIKNQIVNRKIGFNTIFIGNNKTSNALYDELQNEKYSQGYAIRGYIGVEGEPAYKSELAEVGQVKDIAQVIKDKNVEEVIIALESDHKAQVNEILERLDGENVIVKIIPDMYDIMAGRVKIRNVFGTALIEIYPEILPPLQANVKRILDVVASGTMLLLLSPLYLILSIWVKSTSKGPVFYKQERIGYKGKPFHIIKFRTMYTDAEKGTPRLSSDNDPRITSAGRILRKYRLDEIPQFYNVFIGEMSLVGPRPERQFFIDQIVLKAPQYKHLTKVKPGITAWGMVKYGYAENVDEMIERMKYDLLYIENMSLSMDFKIMAYTIITILGGRGK